MEKSYTNWAVGRGDVLSVAMTFHLIGCPCTWPGINGRISSPGSYWNRAVRILRIKLQS